MLTTLAVAALAAAVVALLTMRQEVVVDEAWHLVVVDRVLHRQNVLYRDVFYGAGPLPVWLLAGAVRLGGLEARVLRVVNAATSGVLVGALWHLTQGVGLPAWASALTAAVTVLGCGPVADLESLYANLTRAGLAIAFAGSWAGGSAAMVLAAVGVAMAALAKYTAALGAGPFVLAVAWLRAEERWSVAVGVAVVAALCWAAVAPVARHRDGFDAMRQRLGPNKRSYLQYGRHSMRRTFTGGGAADRLLVPSVVPAGAAVVLALVAWPGGVATVALVGGLLAAWFLLGWPRWDSCHLRSGLPFVTVAALVAGHAAGDTRERLRSVVVVLAVALAAWGCALVVVGLRDAIRRGAFGPASDVPGFRGTGCPFTPDAIEDLAVASRLAGGVALLLGSPAPLAYLVAGIHNPTAYDYPYASTFGPTGQDEVVARLAAGDIRWVIRVYPLPGPMAPATIDRWVDRHGVDHWASPRLQLLRCGGDEGPHPGSAPRGTEPGPGR